METDGSGMRKGERWGRCGLHLVSTSLGDPKLLKTLDTFPTSAETGGRLIMQLKDSDKAICHDLSYDSHSLRPVRYVACAMIESCSTAFLPWALESWLLSLLPEMAMESCLFGGFQGDILGMKRLGESRIEVLHLRLKKCS